MNSLHSGACAPVTAERARATSPDSRPMSTESVDARPHHRQVRRHPLVEVDEFVDLGAGQSPTPLDQLLEPVPRRAMRQHERVDIHLADPSSVGRYGRPARTSGDRGRRGPRRSDRPATGSRAVGDDRRHRDVHRLHHRRDAVGDHADAVRLRAVGCGADHLHRAGDGGLSDSCSRPRPAAGRWARWRWGCGWCPTTAARNASARRCFARWPG